MSDTNQEMWPFGPAPQRECSAGGEHDWKIIDLAAMFEPPAPSFQCAKCSYRWSRDWTKAEFIRWFSQFGRPISGYDAISLEHMRDEPPYKA